MPDTEDVQRYADAIMALTKEDQDIGQVPRDICSRDELDDGVDAGDHCRLARMPSGTPRRDWPAGRCPRRSRASLPVGGWLQSPKVSGAGAKRPWQGHG